MGGLSDLCFDIGVKFSQLVSQHFGCSVSPTTPFTPLAFQLVASFGRSTIRLNEDSIGLILQAWLGRSAKDYNVFHLSGWMFSVSISCKNVGLMVNKLKSFSYKSFTVFFYLLGGEGANWRKEYDLWFAEQEAEWTIIGTKSKSYAEIVRSPPIPKK